MPKTTDFGATIRKAMKADGRTIYAIARDAGLGVSIVQRFAAGRDIRLESASRICECLGLDLIPRNTKATVRVGK